ncbi:SDR family NAD(P)-dependent oxidoreductase [Henriciella marina]|uniref:SDR family NAD(P)-dependent oxidoreductase n=1 Tax=Henriciella marina TaxID=453851 RepID=A0ABT4LUB5_9PROT|nr:SDR family oxidoreductase [Henriciella marina]MCZ4297960.1 SDR family NAD(P)-dependent oxidoreductase [Henriciella marina]
MATNMENRTVVITGGATGIGFALARQFGADGARIILAEPRENRLQEACEALKETGTEANYKVCDVTDLTQVEALADYAWQTYGGCDVLLNNAGVGSREKRLPDVPMDDAHHIMNVNFWGVWHGCRVFGERMKDQGTPAMIYNTGSENSFFCATNAAAYIASKHAVLGLTETFREQMPDFITVGMIIPGWVSTELTPGFEDVAMHADEFAGIIYPQILEGERFVVSHAYNTVRIDERMEALKHAYARYAPRHEGDEEYDVRLYIQRIRERGSI